MRSGLHVVATHPLLFFGEVMHSRLRPRRNRFVYRVFFLSLRVDQIDALRGPLFSVDRWNLFSLHRRDHGARDGSELEPWIRGLLAREGLDRTDGPIWLQTFPRVLGYVFNPVSFWLCHDRAGGLRAVLCQVRNTFGEHHNYLLAHCDQRPILRGERLTARKVFHVSPFCEIDGCYRFRFALDRGACAIRIDYDDTHGPLLVTSLRGRGEAMTTRSLARAFAYYPWMTLAVIPRIHWQALRLWLKGCRFRPHPAKQSSIRVSQ
jgi:uncharacterized protein